MRCMITKVRTTLLVKRKRMFLYKMAKKVTRFKKRAKTGVSSLHVEKFPFFPEGRGSGPKVARASAFTVGWLFTSEADQGKYLTAGWAKKSRESQEPRCLHESRALPRNILEIHSRKKTKNRRALKAVCPNDSLPQTGVGFPKKSGK